VEGCCGNFAGLCPVSDRRCDWLLRFTGVDGQTIEQKLPAITAAEQWTADNIRQQSRVIH